MKVIAVWVVSLLVVIGAGVGVEAGIGVDRGSATTAPATSMFFGLASNGPGTPQLVEEFSMTTGAVLRTVATLPLVPVTGVPDTCPTKPVFIDSLTPTADGSLWLDESSHAPCQGNAAGQSIPDNHCSGTVLRLDPISGVSKVVVRVPASLALKGAVPSSDGRYLALLVSPCELDAEQDFFVVEDLSTDRTWDVGSGGPPCRTFSVPAWTSGARDLLFVLTTIDYFPPVPGVAGRATALCGGPTAADLAVLSARQPVSLSEAKVVPPSGPAHQCEVDATAPDPSGVLVAESCGSSLDSPIGRDTGTLVQLDGDGRIVRSARVPAGRFAIGLCATASGSRILVQLAKSENPCACGLLLETELGVLESTGLQILPESPSSPYALSALGCPAA